MKSELELQDYDEIMLDDWTLTPLEDLFNMNQFTRLPYERDDDIWISVTVEMDLHIAAYER